MVILLFCVEKHISFFIYLCCELIKLTDVGGGNIDSIKIIMGKKKVKDEVVPTACTDWSLNDDSESKKQFWWNKTYSISIWNANLKFTSPFSQITDDDVWRRFIEYQLNAVYKVCAICKHPEGNEDLLVCCYCASTVHSECSQAASAEQIQWKPANKSFSASLRACVACNDTAETVVPPRPYIREKDNARRAVMRALRLEEEYPPTVTKSLRALEALANAPHNEKEDEKLMDSIRNVLLQYFQPGVSASLVVKQPIKTKGNGIGVVAAVDIPAFTVIGVYPGYEDPLSGEQVKIGRPGPKYSLVDLNCADYFNDVFTEYQKMVTPFVNEPNEGEKSNCAWIQEPYRPEGRLSIMNVRDVKAGEELLIGYGPLYPRDYPHAYDAYAFHSVDGYENPPCLALWHWTSVEEKDSEFVCYIGYDEATRVYSYWETEDEVRDKAPK